MGMQQPFQALALLSLKNETSLLLAACGSNIVTIDCRKCQVISRWDGSRDGVKSFILSLLLSVDEKYLFAATAQDKAILTFSISSTGQLGLLSRRSMPKRPCALANECSGEYLLVGDKFGDVYCLPLLESQSSASKPAKISKSSGPSANELTVHTERNRKALQNQISARGSESTDRRSTQSEHELVVGHVSMLTDITCGTFELSDGSRRCCIITADRDEHIRITRGLQQSHIIHTFCFGHEAFVSKICLLNNKILVSGGGDNFLFIWDWYHGRLVGRLEIASAVRKLSASYSAKTDIAVSGLWALTSVRDCVSLACACEGVEGIIYASISFTDGTTKIGASSVRAVELEGKPLGAVSDGITLIVSLDNTGRPSQSDAIVALDIISADTDEEGLGLRKHLLRSQSLSKSISQYSDSIEVPDLEHLHDYWYPYGKLRKQRGSDEYTS